MKPTIASANRWIAKKALLQARQKRFLRAAALMHWTRFVGVASALWVLGSVMGTNSNQVWIKVAYVGVAVGYVLVDLHYSRLELRRRAERAKWRRSTKRH